MRTSSKSKTTTHGDASPDHTRDDGDGASAAFYFFLGALALSLLTMLGALFFT